MRPSATTLVCFLGAFIAAPRLSAQSNNFIPVSGRYGVTAEFMGTGMDPWDAKVSVRDTVVDGKKTVAITQIATRIDPRITNTETALLDPETGRMVEFFGQDGGGPHEGHYALRASNGHLKGTAQASGELPLSVDEPLRDGSLPDYIAPFVLAARQLKDGDTVAVHVFTYQASTTGIFGHDLSAVVRSASFQRSGASAPEPVWVIAGGSGYAAKYIIAKGDHRVLSAIFPQGTDGTETHIWVGPNPE